jgi:predicted short-subunit dehydrogenase-like oxidoreductase (DUF2520 family)
MNPQPISGRKVSRAESAKTVSSISVIGMGNWGTSLVAALKSAGIPPREVVLRKRSSRKRPESNITTLDRAALDAQLIWLCVPDRMIAEIAARLVLRRKQQGFGLKGQILAHSSGVLSVDALAAAQSAGARVASIHPLMTFPTRKPASLAQVPFSVEATPSLSRTLFALVRALGGTPFRVPSQNKALYHAAATMASPLLLSALVAAQQTAVLAGLSREQAAKLLAPMAARTIANFLAKGPSRSFSGPIARGDAETIELHLRALSKHPILADTYRTLALNAVEYLPSSKKRDIFRKLAKRQTEKHVG